MARGSDDARAAASQGLQSARQYQGQARGIYNTLLPTLTNEALNPQGFSEADRAAMDTAALQTAGGANAGAVGQGSLMAARTRNAGGADAAISESVRDTGRQIMEQAVGNRVKGSMLKQDQRRAAIAGMGNLFDTSTGAGNAALGQVASNTNADAQQKQASWGWTSVLSPIMSAFGPSAAQRAFGGGR